MNPPNNLQITNRLQKAMPLLSDLLDRDCDHSALKRIGQTAINVSVPKGTKLNREQNDALFQSISHLEGKQLTEQLLRKNMHRLVANFHFIMDGMAIPVWNGERIAADAVFIGVLRGKCKEGEKPRYHVVTKLKSGIGAGIIVCYSLYDAALYNFVDKVAGTSQYHCAPEEIAGMECRMTLCVLQGQPKLLEWDTTQAQKKHNRLLAELRADITKCRLNRPCNTCSKNILQCKLAVWMPRKENENGRGQAETKNNSALHKNTGG
jgi:hypothetical protein